MLADLCQPNEDHLLVAGGDFPLEPHRAIDFAMTYRSKDSFEPVMTLPRWTAWRLSPGPSAPPRPTRRFWPTGGNKRDGRPHAVKADAAHSQLPIDPPRSFGGEFPDAPLSFAFVDGHQQPLGRTPQRRSSSSASRGRCNAPAARPLCSPRAAGRSRRAERPSGGLLE